MGETRLSRIQSRLESAFAPARITVRDDSKNHVGHPGASSGAGHFAVRIESKTFKGRNQLQRHRMVYDALADLMPGEIHALMIETISPDEEQPRKP